MFVKFLVCVQRNKNKKIIIIKKSYFNSELELFTSGRGNLTLFVVGL